MKKIVISHRSIHHSGYSGYSRLIDFLGDTIKIPSEEFTTIIPYRVSKFIASNLDQKKGIYNSDSVEKEIELFSLLKNHKNEKKVIHYLNAERDIRFVVNKKRMFNNSSFIGTFHKPNEVLEKQTPSSKYLKKLDGAICVGPNQVDFIKNWLHMDNVKFIPHGIDTKFFKPNLNKREENTLLFVGQHLRDFKSFNYCIPKIAEKIPSLKVNVILHRSYKKYIAPHKAINVFSNLNDMELKEHYQIASALFLPMLNSTACNSILEAMSCGLPVITTGVGGNSSYLKGTNNVLAPLNNKDILIDAAIELLKNEDTLFDNGKLSREKALKYDWGKIAVQIEKFYKSNVR